MKRKIISAAVPVLFIILLLTAYIMLPKRLMAKAKEDKLVQSGSFSLSDLAPYDPSTFLSPVEQVRRYRALENGETIGTSDITYHEIPDIYVYKNYSENLDWLPIFVENAAPCAVNYDSASSLRSIENEPLDCLMYSCEGEEFYFYTRLNETSCMPMTMSFDCYASADYYFIVENALLSAYADYYGLKFSLADYSQDTMRVFDLLEYSKEYDGDMETLMFYYTDEREGVTLCITLYWVPYHESFNFSVRSELYPTDEGDMEYNSVESY